MKKLSMDQQVVVLVVVVDVVVDVVVHYHLLLRILVLLLNVWKGMTARLEFSTWWTKIQ
jgi:hypothetical protein